MCIVLPLPNLLKGLEIMNEKISMKDPELTYGLTYDHLFFFEFFMQWTFEQRPLTGADEKAEESKPIYTKG